MRRESSRIKVQDRFYFPRGEIHAHELLPSHNVGERYGGWAHAVVAPPAVEIQEDRPDRAAPRGNGQGNQFGGRTAGRLMDGLKMLSEGRAVGATPRQLKLLLGVRD